MCAFNILCYYMECSLMELWFLPYFFSFFSSAVPDVFLSDIRIFTFQPGFLLRDFLAYLGFEFIELLSITNLNSDSPFVNQITSSHIR